MKREGLKRIDWVIVATSVLLVIIGLLVLFSSGIKPAETTAEIDTTRQILYAAVGVAVALMLLRLDYRSLRSYVVPMYIVTLIALVAVEFVGKSALGAQRWINLGFFQFQPSEFSKLAFIVVLATYYSRVYGATKQLRYTLTSLFLLIPLLILVIGQPDLGTGLVFSVIWIAMTIGTLLPKRYLVFAGSIGVLALPIIYQFLAPYQKSRLQVLLNPQADRLGIGYNVVQSVIAVGSGGWFGRGLTAGSQSQLNFLPSQHTDFIFAVLAEKLGFVGAALTIILFCILITRIFLVGLQSNDRLGSFLCIGIGGMLLFHVLINIGMNMGIMPVTGIPLPFISAGGTSMLINCAAIGVVLSVSSRRTGVRHIKDAES
ncbi:rod shape-determining protein RodA [bacterium]|nr:rod shape-determining protein RodA [bacterium]